MKNLTKFQFCWKSLRWLWLSDDDDDDEFLLHLNVTFHVQCKMITTWEAAFTVTALEWFRACVFSIVSSEFVASCETPFASFPGALVGLFTCNWREKNNEINFWDFFLHLELFLVNNHDRRNAVCNISSNLRFHSPKIGALKTFHRNTLNGLNLISKAKYFPLHTQQSFKTF